MINITGTTVPLSHPPPLRLAGPSQVRKYFRTGHWSTVDMWPVTSLPVLPLHSYQSRCCIRTHPIHIPISPICYVPN